MNLLLNLHGIVGIVLLCFLLYIEEAGVPLFFIPGEGVLIVAGILIANDSVPLWIFLPLACAAVLGGAITGYAWTRTLGSQGLGALAGRLGLSNAVDRAADRLRLAGPAGIGVCRLIPGMRVNATLVAGAFRLDFRSFLLGITPAAVVWVVAFTLLGMVVGLPAQHVLGSVGRLVTDGAVLIAVAVGGFFTLRHIPPVEQRDNALLRAPRPERLALALLVDLAIVASLVLGAAALIRAGVGIGDVDGFVDFVVIAVASVAAYAVAARRGVGLTGGEALLNVSYRPAER